MKKFTMFATLAMAMVFAVSSFAADLPKITQGNSTIHGGSISTAKALLDTVDVMGAATLLPVHVGDFAAGWNGWTAVDNTTPVTHFHISNFNQALPTNLAAYCGDETIASCGADSVGGYGNGWNDMIAYRVTVADPLVSATVSITATLQWDSEPGYDFTYMSAKMQGIPGYTDAASWDGVGAGPVAGTFTYLPADLVGGTDIYVLFRFTSDGGWSDGDCSWPTNGGACQVDDVTVTVSQAGQLDIVNFNDFQVDFGAWFLDAPIPVGNFGHLWSGLEDVDPCATNYSQQVAFIDDGIVVPGTGGSNCVNWCYGPAGYIVTTTGGIAGATSHLDNAVRSPAMVWPNAAYDGIIFAFDVYVHEDLSFDAPGIFYTWDVRSADTDGSAGPATVLASQPWLNRNFVYYGAPSYRRVRNEVTDLMDPGRDVVQVQMGVLELGYIWGWSGNDGYPAPYFDNVSVKVFPYFGPGMSARELDLAQDNFPAVDAIDFLNLGSLSVRFDMANNIAPSGNLQNDPGDSIIVSIVPVRSGAVLAGAPTLNYIINPNPVFDIYRTSGLPLGGSVNGLVGLGDKFTFDLPDSNFLFPGDVLHYYIEAGDQLGPSIQLARMPSDTTGFSDFSGPTSYSSTFTIHALPSIKANNTQPGILFWNDFANRGGEAEWYGALNNLGLIVGQDYDIYYTNAPSSGVGNGIGGRTSGLALSGYSDMLYTSGSLGVFTLSNGDFLNDAGDDIGALNLWLSAGNKDIFLTGDDLVSDLAVNAGPTALAFSTNVMGVTFQGNNLRSFIGNQATPLVKALPGNPVIMNVASWIAYGGCVGINTFDAVTTAGSAVRLAEFTDANGLGGAYTFSAATSNVSNLTNRIVSMPYDLMFVYDTGTAGKIAAPLSARAQILQDVLGYFGVAGAPGAVTPVLPSKQFAVANYPNPFNPATKIAYTIKGAGHLTLKVFNVRGELVKTLIDGNVISDGSVMWDGTNNQGSNVSSGVYFYEARMGNDVQVNKMALVK